MFQTEGGTCEDSIGPLEEDQLFVPPVLHWPESQPTMIARLDRIEKTISTGGKNDDTNINTLHKASIKGHDLEDFAHVIESKLNTQSTGMQGKVEGIESKLDAHSAAMQTRVDAELKEVKDMVQAEIKEIKDMVQAEIKGEKDMVQAEIKKEKDMVQAELKEMKDMVQAEIKEVKAGIKEVKVMVFNLLELNKHLLNRSVKE
jgi:hypothetical protein